MYLAFQALSPFAQICILQAQTLFLFPEFAMDRIIVFELLIDIFQVKRRS
jgi:hypothetical protein